MSGACGAACAGGTAVSAFRIFGVNVTGVLFGPQAVSGGHPAGCVGTAAAENILRGFRLLHIGAVGTAAANHIAQNLGVLQHRAGTQMVAVEGLALVIFLEQGLLQAFQQALVMDVGAGVMDEYAGLHIAVGVDVSILAAAGDTAVNVLAVVLEVNAENLLAAGKAADLAYTLDHVLTLFGIQHQVNVSTIADGHIVEVPVEAHAVADEHIHEFIAGNSLVVGGSVADGGTKQQAVLFHDVHSVHNALEHAFAAAAVGGIIQALNGQEESHVADFLDFLAESIVDQSTIGEQVEHGALVLGSQLEQIVLAAHRLAAGAHIPVDAQLFTLGNQLVHFLIGQVQAVAVLGSPAALAMQVAGGGGVKQQDPRHVAIILLRSSQT